MENLTKHEVINIAYGQRTTLNQLWQRIKKITGIDLSAIYIADRKGDVKHSLASIEKGKNLIGYEPEISVEEGLEMAVEWYRLHNSPINSL